MHGTAAADHQLQLAQGSQRLADGVALLASRLPENVASLTGSASGLAESIQPRIEVVAPVANQGSGFTPNFAPIALWVGATLCTFLFAYRWLPRPLAGQPPLAVVLGKLLVPGLVLLLQTLILLAMLFGLLQVEVVSVPWLESTPSMVTGPMNSAMPGGNLVMPFKCQPLAGVALRRQAKASLYWLLGDW